jgi:integrase
MASVVKDSRSRFWWARYRDNAGREYTRSTKQTSKGKALQVAAEYERVSRGCLLPVKAALLKLGEDLCERLGQTMDDATVEEELKSFVSAAGARAESTRERYEQIMREFLDFIGPVAASQPLSTLTSAQVDGYRLSRLGKGLAGKTVNFELKFLRSLLKRAMMAGRIGRNVAMNIPFEKVHPATRKAFSVEQIQSLMRACERFKGKKGVDWKGAVGVAFYLGARLSDVANLKTGDLLLEAEKPALSYLEKKKPGADKVTKILPHHLHEYLLSLPSSDDPETPLFPHLVGRKTGGAHGLSREFVELMEAAGIERRAVRIGKSEGGKAARTIYDLSEHSLRHSTATQYAEAGVPEDIRQHLIGHESKEVNRGYTHPEKAIVKAIQSLPSVFPIIDKKG